MNLPLKLVDLVTLLFLSLLVVIIVFIILQRNIKRFKLRNLKDSHYLTCKSIPQDLKDAIEKKHAMSNSYKEPPNLLSESHINQTDENTKSYILRMKAFEVSKSLENALSECGYRRLMSKKFEEYIDEDLVLNTDDKTLPKSLLNDFVVLYIWAMHDPMEFTREKLRKLNQLINKIITILAFNKTEIHDQIIQHKLELDSLGDFDFNKMFNNSQNPKSRSNSNGNNIAANLNNNNNNIPENNTYSERIRLKKLQHLAKESASKTSVPDVISLDELNNAKLKKSKITKNASNKSSKKLFQKASTKYEEIKDTSAQSNVSGSFSNSKLNFIKKSKQSLNETNESNNQGDWLITNERLNNFDSENEEIPLVAKKASNHQKKKSNLSNILIGPPAKSSTIQQVKTSPSNSVLLSTVSTNPAGNIQITSITGEENEGFNKTFETIF